MKRSLVLSVCAAALAACFTHSAMAVVDVQLNLRYDDPANEAAGGTWDLLVQTDSAFGLAGIQVLIGGDDLGVTGIDSPALQITPNSNVFDNVDSVFRFGTHESGFIDITAGDDLDGPLVTGVGTGGASAGNVENDDLFPGNSPVWDNSALIASGSFGANRPTIENVFANEFDSATTIAGSLAVIGDTSVRGDSVATDGLQLGDTDRNGVVNLSDLGTLAFNLDAPGTFGWGDGDTDSNTNVNLSDLGNLAFNLDAPGTTPPAFTVVPEPASAALLCMAVSLTCIRRRR